MKNENEWPKLGEDVTAVLDSNGAAVIAVFCKDYKVASGWAGFHGEGTKQIVKLIGEDPQLSHISNLDDTVVQNIKQLGHYWTDVPIAKASTEDGKIVAAACSWGGQGRVRAGRAAIMATRGL